MFRKAEKPNHFQSFRAAPGDCNRAKEKTFCALRKPQKVLVVELFALPDAPGASRQAPC